MRCWLRGCETRASDGTYENAVGETKMVSLTKRRRALLAKKGQEAVVVRLIDEMDDGRMLDATRRELLT